jgi:RimJ/RimL family protein N-acetyltransferase
MRMSAGDYELDDDPSRVDADAAVAFLTTEAYWARWRGAQDIKGQIAAAWRVVGVYDRAGAMVGFARAWGDGGNAYLSDVYVLPEHRGAGLGQAILMLTHAFEVWQVSSVALHTDARNQRSRDAMARIGLRYEGVLRAQRLGTDGKPRDSARFSVTAADWPAVRQHFDELDRRYQRS